MTVHVSVAIVGFRNAGDVAACLDALGRSTHQDFEVIICENGGAEAFAALAVALPEALAGGQRVRAVLAPGNLGYAGGLNLCFRETPGADAWWALNPDTEPQPPAMAALVERLARGDCAAAGGVLIGPDGAVQSYGGRWQAWAARPVALGRGRPADDAIDAPAIEAKLSYLSGASMMVDRRFVETVGPLREDYFLYCEEVEWCLRGLARGLRLGLAPQCRVLHRQGGTTGSGEAAARRPRLAVFLGERNKLLLTWDRFPWRTPLAAPLALGLIVLRYARRGAWRQLGYALDGWWSGLIGRRGRPDWVR